LWDKRVHLLCGPDGCEYQMELSETGEVNTLHLFEGLRLHAKDNLSVKHLNDKRSTPYERYSTKSPARFRRLLVPESNVYHEQLLPPEGFAQIGPSCALDQHRGNFIGQPGIVCFRRTRTGPVPRAWPGGRARRASILQLRVPGCTGRLRPTAPLPRPVAGARPLCHTADPPAVRGIGGGSPPVLHRLAPA
jgi:hypothetical protein